MEGGRPLCRGRRGPAGIYPFQGAPVIVGGLWRLNPPQQWESPNRGGPGQRYMENSSEEASCAISYLVF